MIDAAKNIDDLVRKGAAVIGHLTVDFFDAQPGEEKHSVECLVVFGRSDGVCDRISLYTVTADDVTFDVGLDLNSEYYANHVEFGVIGIGPLDWLLDVVYVAYGNHGFTASGHLYGDSVALYKRKDSDLVEVI